MQIVAEPVVKTMRKVVAEMTIVNYRDEILMEEGLKQAADVQQVHL